MRQLSAWRICVAGLLMAIAGPVAAFAQGEPRASVAAGYVFLQQQPSGGLDSPIYPFGWVAAGAVRLGSSRLSGVGEVGVSYRSADNDEHQHLMGVFGGARFALHSSKHVVLFAQGVVGIERFSEPGLVESGLAIQPGGGADFLLSPRVFLRVQGDYRWSQPNDATFHSYRAVAAVGVRIN